MLGVDEDRFWDSQPVELEPYRKMDKMQQERRDYEQWMMGQYTFSAVYTAVSNALLGKKSRAKYVEKPLLQSIKHEEKHDPKADFIKFSAWATVFNENFSKKHEGQG